MWLFKKVKEMAKFNPTGCKMMFTTNQDDEIVRIVLDGDFNQETGEGKIQALIVDQVDIGYQLEKIYKV